MSLANPFRIAASCARVNVDTVTNASVKPTRAIQPVASGTLVSIEMNGNGPINVNAITSPRFPSTDSIVGYAILSVILDISIRLMEYVFSSV